MDSLRPLCSTPKSPSRRQHGGQRRAHALCEYKLNKALGHRVRDPTPDLEFFNDEMDECADSCCAFVTEQIEKAKEHCKDPIVLVEQKLDFSHWVKDSFGTADCVIVADDVLTVIDFKYGLGVLVSVRRGSKETANGAGVIHGKRPS